MDLTNATDKRPNTAAVVSAGREPVFERRKKKRKKKKKRASLDCESAGESHHKIRRFGTKRAVCGNRKREADPSELPAFVSIFVTFPFLGRLRDVEDRCARSREVLRIERMRDGNVYCCGLSERPAGDADVRLDSHNFVTTRWVKEGKRLKIHL